jgi:5-methylcytosine-specific restriction enzyme subunit McrC
MNELFERFVTQLLKKYLPKDTKVLEQKRFKKAIVRNGSSYRDIIPDILIQYPQGHTLVIDTKYKPYGQKKVSNQDMYQLLFYSQFIVGENGSPHSLIIFPQYEGEEMVEEKMKMLPDSIYEATLEVKSIQIERMLEALKKQEFEVLEETARRLIEL